LKLTCYIPPDTVHNGSKRMTLCGRYIRPHEHSETPTCPACADVLAATDTRPPEQVFGTEAPGQPVPYVDYDPITGDELPERY
jgi:hypothetical protein